MPKKKSEGQFRLVDKVNNNAFTAAVVLVFVASVAIISAGKDIFDIYKTGHEKMIEAVREERDAREEKAMARFERAEAQRAAAESDVRSAEAQLELAERTNRNKTTMIHELKSQINRREEQIQELLKGYNASEQQMELGAEVTAMQKEKQVLQSKVDALESENAKIKIALGQARQKPVTWPEHTITFTITGKNHRQRCPTPDWLALVFSDVSAKNMKSYDGGTGNAAEFWFDGSQASKGRTCILQRKIRGLGFLDAKYIRLVNHGDDGWCPGTLSATLDGKPLISPTQLSVNVTGSSSNEHYIQDYATGNWKLMGCWEASLKPLLVPQ